MRKHVSKFTISLMLLMFICIIVIPGFVNMESPRETSAIEPLEKEFVHSAIMGTHTVQIYYWKAEIIDDHDPITAGEWKFGLGPTWTNYVVSNDEFIVVEDPDTVYPGLLYSIQITAYSTIKFGAYAGEWDRVLWWWEEDHIVGRSWLIYPQYRDMNRWYTLYAHSDSLNQYIKFRILNSAPIAYGISDGTIVQGQSITLSGSGYDPEGDGIQRYEWDSDFDGVQFTPEHYTSSPTIIYDTPGTYTVAYRLVDDFDAAGNIQTAKIVVLPLNIAPVAEDDAVSTAEDTAIAIDVLDNDSDANGDALTIDSIAPPSHGTVELVDGLITYTPDANYNGPDSFTYTISDGNGGTDNAMVTITVNPVNDAPVGVDDTFTIDEDTLLILPAPGLLSNDYDVDGDTIFMNVLTYPQNGDYIIEGNGLLEYYPDADWYGTDSFTYKVGDGTDWSGIVTVTIIVTSVNDAPVADAGGPYTADEGIQISFDASGSSDIEGDQLQFRWDFDNDGSW
ncbi:MAG: Ig-like domain-containing protein, partial [Candidatus Thorarchaeota archaeon]